jgi:hypothetical protein
MLGRKHDEKKLREDGGRSAPATVTALKQGHIGMATGGQAFGGQNSTINYHFTLQVMPDGETPFEATVSDRILISNSPPGVGSTIFVLFDPDDHSKVRIDHSNSAMVATFASGISDNAKSAIQAAGASDAVANLMQQAADNPEALLASLRGKNEQGAIADFRSQLKPPVSAPAAQSPPDPVTQLTALADLRDRGVLTDDVFDAQKKRILGE